MTGRKISDRLFPQALESRREEIEGAAASAGVGDAYAWVFALGVQYAEAKAQDASRVTDGKDAT